MTLEAGQELLSSLIDEIKAGDDHDLTDPTWEAVFRRVPRHPFLNGFYVTSEDPSRRYEYVSAVDQERWRRHVYSNLALVTRINEHEKPMSSSSMPSMMSRFLHLLDVRDGDRVLEIGTGTGYNAALLCARLGSENVTTIDIDPVLADAARAALAQTGYAPTIAVADGAGGYPPGAPYDRILSTASVSRVPTAWIEQLRPGGVIVTPLAPPIDYGLVALRDQPDGSLEGRLDLHGADFMALRPDADDYPNDPLWRELLDVIYEPQGGDENRLPLPEWLSDPWRAGLGTLRLVRLRIPNLEWFWFPGPAGPHTLPGIVSREDRSWVRVYVADDGTTTVRQGGPRRLWPLLMETHSLWLRMGQPDMARYGLTIRSGGQDQFVWLDSPDSEHRWRL